MSKIRVLVLPSDRTGVGKFRSVEPHIFLQNQNPDDFHVDIDYDPKINDDNFWKGYDMVHFHQCFELLRYLDLPQLMSFLLS